MLIAYFAPLPVPCRYLVPYWVGVVWLDVVTYLQHHGPEDPSMKMPWYRGEVCCMKLSRWFREQGIPASQLQTDRLVLVYAATIGHIGHPDGHQQTPVIQPWCMQLEGCLREKVEPM